MTGIRALLILFDSNPNCHSMVQTQACALDLSCAWSRPYPEGSGGNPEMIDKGPLPPDRGACIDSAPWWGPRVRVPSHAAPAVDLYSTSTTHVQ
jgi:hypothetical protein